MNRTGGFKGQGQICELCSGGICSLRGISFSYRFPFIREQEYVWAEILINPCSAADQSAAAPGLLSKGAAEFGHSPSLQARGQDCLYPPLSPLPSQKAEGSLAPGSTLQGTPQELSSPSPCQHPGGPIWDGAGWPRSIPRAGGAPTLRKKPQGRIFGVLGRCCLLRAPSGSSHLCLHIPQSRLGLLEARVEQRVRGAVRGRSSSVASFIDCFIAKGQRRAWRGGEEGGGV